MIAQEQHGGGRGGSCVMTSRLSRLLACAALTLAPIALPAAAAADPEPARGREQSWAGVWRNADNAVHIKAPSWAWSARRSIGSGYPDRPRPLGPAHGPSLRRHREIRRNLVLGHRPGGGAGADRYRVRDRGVADRVADDAAPATLGPFKKTVLPRARESRATNVFRL